MEIKCQLPIEIQNIPFKPYYLSFYLVKRWITRYKDFDIFEFECNQCDGIQFAYFVDIVVYSGDICCSGNSVRIGLDYDGSNNKLNITRLPLARGGKRIINKKDSLYSRWSQIKYRTLNPKSASWFRYGGRGIKLHSEWLDFEKFKHYISTHLGECPPNYQLDRIDPDNNYEPGNIRWVDRKTNMQNTVSSNIKRRGGRSMLVDIEILKQMGYFKD